MKTSLIIDTNLLVLLVVGGTNGEFIGRHKRLGTFTMRDFQELRDIVSRASEVLVTPNTLTETSNLAAQIAEPARSQIRHTLRAVVESCTELYVRSSAAATRPEFIRIGLTDSALLEVASNDAVLLTADLDLYLAAVQSKREVINFNHLRERWL